MPGRQFPFRRRSIPPSKAICRRKVRASTVIVGMVMAVLLVGGCTSTASKSSAPPSHNPTASSSPGVPLGADCRNLGTCYAPGPLRVAYGIQPLLDRGISGRGVTVVLLETAAPAPSSSSPAATDIRQDLAQFDRLFGLPAAQLQVVSSLAGSNAPYQAAAGEVRDAEIVHAVALDASIRVVLAGATVSSQFAALRLGMTQGTVLLISVSVGEHCLTGPEVTALNSALQAAESRHVTVVNSTGEFGASVMPCPGATAITPVKGVDLPAADPLVLAVGGTSLVANRTTGARVSETAWNAPPNSLGAPESLASGGGFSQQFARPSYQDGVAGIGSSRGVPDVSADADPTLGPAIVVAVRNPAGPQNAASPQNAAGLQKVVAPQYLVRPAGTTAAAAAIWAGLIALADQDAGHGLGLVNPAIYRIGRGSAYSAAFHAITTGTNTVQFPKETITGYPAASGWNPVTGWGSPNAQVLIPLLVRYG
jgi:subtilase family serine protease